MLPGKSLHEIFEARARECAENVAVVTLDEEISYAELDSRADCLAGRLKELGVGPDVLVGLCVDRSIELIVGLVGILKAGGAYLPIDPEYPDKHIQFLLSDSSVGVVVTVSRVADRVRDFDATSVCIDGETFSGRIMPVSVGRNETHQSDLAYAIYTSGSTGLPKGVLIEHDAVVRLFEQTHDWFGFDENDVWTMFHSISFDFSVWEIWGALLYGGRVIVVPQHITRSPAEFHALLKDHRVTILNQTPSAFRQLIAADRACGEGADLDIRFVILGGEALNLGMLDPWIESHGDARPALINMYGITETTVHVTFKRILREDVKRRGVSPIGVPIPDLQVYLLDEAGRPVPDGAPGEIYVSGPGLAREYLNRPSLTAERFAPKPGIGPEGARLYCSRDRAMRMPGGELAYLGRSDSQLKVRGFRIEPGEIEFCLSGHPAVSNAVVISHDYGEGDSRLVAFIVKRSTPGHADPPTEELTWELAKRAADHLPDHMLPSAYFVLPEIPLTAHGKMDFESLRQQAERKRERRNEARAPMTATERVIIGIWEDILQCGGLGMDDDFFDAGGTSLALIRVLGGVNQYFHIDLNASVLAEGATVARLAGSVDEFLRNNDAQLWRNDHAECTDAECSKEHTAVCSQLSAVSELS